MKTTFSAKRFGGFLLLPPAFLAVFWSSLGSCNDFKRNNSHPDITNESIRKGKKLASQYCQSCHLLPDPALLSSKVWAENVLPQMGPRLGIFEYWNQRYPSEINNKNLNRNYYPPKPLLSFDEWQHILDYYIASSPDSMPRQMREEPIKMGLKDFEIKIPPMRYAMPAVGFVKMEEGKSVNSLFVSDLVKKTLFRFDGDLNLLDSLRSSGPIVDLAASGNGFLACNIGELGPHIGKLGSVLKIQSGERLHAESPSFFKDLERPVQLSLADLNGDGKEDYLICEFGHLTGSLSWMENLGGNRYKKHVLRNSPGAIRAYVEDYNRDGLPDIWVLFAQAEETIFLFTNEGKGQFRTQEVLKFPPVIGSSYFELCDFNKDGHPDIVYTAGDNADFSKILKPYHGIYIFLNNGKNKFRQAYFFPMNGCYKAIARDFDQDGDIDIAAIAFFADYEKQPEEGFVYLENVGNFRFKPWSFHEVNQGRWLSMEAGDINGDGKTDLILGNFSVLPSAKASVNWQNGPPFIVLKNISKYIY